MDDSRISVSKLDEKLPPLAKNSKQGPASSLKRKVAFPEESGYVEREEQDADAEMHESEPEDDEPPDLRIVSQPSQPKKVILLTENSKVSNKNVLPLKQRLVDPIVDPLREKQPIFKAQLMNDDNHDLPNSAPGQSNAYKKSNIPVKVKFNGEESSSSKQDSKQSGLSGQSGQSSKSLQSDSDNQKIEKAAMEAKAKREYDRFYPIFQEVYKLQALKKKGYKPNTGDFFAAYLQGIKKADQAREEELKSKDREFFETVRKLIDHQDKRTREIMARVEENELERRERIEERMGKLGNFMLYDFKKQKEEAAKVKAAQTAKERQYYEYLMKMGMTPNPMMQNVRPG